MRISDWSSDVCSSDLRRQLRRRAGVADAQAARLAEGRARHAGHALGFEQRVAQFDIVADDLAVVRLAEGDADVRERVERTLRRRADHAGDRVQRGDHLVALGLELGALGVRHVLRSEERRVGKEWFIQGKSRWSTESKKKK